MSQIFQRGTSLPIDRALLFGGNRKRLIAEMKKHPNGTGLVLLKGGTHKDLSFYDTDTELLFRQEAFFHWSFGVETEDVLGVVDLDNATSALFVPKLPAEYAVWMGEIESLSQIKAKYAVEQAHYLEDLLPFLSGRKPSVLHVLEGINSDSGAKALGFDLTPEVRQAAAGAAVDTSLLYPTMVALRRTKSAEEVAAMRYSSRACSEAHVEAMRIAKPGLFEFQLESQFLHTGYSKFGCRFSSYTCIVASGSNPAVLHYGHHNAPNSRQMLDGDMVLCDMGLDYCRYASDITCTYPVNGKFTPEQRLIYEAVLDAHQSIIGRLRPGVNWLDMHTLAYEIILGHLLRAGLVRGGSVQELIEADIGGIFMPHGLGHFLGIDTHDVGGYLDTKIPRVQRPGFKSLRTTRDLEAGNVITVEPGCYFNPYLLEKARQDPAKAKFLDFDVISKYSKVGGVRIEDNVLITANGRESFTRVPRKVEDIERVMAGGEWKFD